MIYKEKQREVLKIRMFSESCWFKMNRRFWLAFPKNNYWMTRLFLFPVINKRTKKTTFGLYKVDENSICLNELKLKYKYIQNYYSKHECLSFEFYKDKIIIWCNSLRKD